MIMIIIRIVAIQISKLTKRYNNKHHNSNLRSLAGARGRRPQGRAGDEHYERDPDPETIAFRQVNTYVKHIVPRSCV